MEIRSLGRKTDLIFAKFSGEVVDRNSYTAIKTPKNPNHHWGNYIIFEKPPEIGSLKEWKNIFDREFSYYSSPSHYVFTWDSLEQSQGNYEEFLANNFELETSLVLTAKTLHPPPYFEKSPRIEIKKILTDSEWEEVTQLQILCADPKYYNSQYDSYKRKQMSQYRKMSDANMGFWFGAYLESQLVADLGIFFEGKIARYQNVGTHPEFRKRGLCGSLVYQTGNIALNEFGVDTLVMEADADYHAARIYESVGFKRSEINYSLSWWKGKTSDTE